MEISYEKTLEIEVLEEFASELYAKAVKKNIKEKSADLASISERLWSIKNEMYTCSKEELKQKEDELRTIKNILDS